MCQRNESLDDLQRLRVADRISASVATYPLHRACSGLPVMLLQTAAFWLSPFLFSVATSTVRAAVAASGAPASMTANTKVSPMKPAWAILDSDRDDKCPPCFNCMLPSFTCMQFGRCSEYNGQCVCPDGFGGQDCSKPLDGSLADGKQRYPRDGNESHCKDGWSGLLCNGTIA